MMGYVINRSCSWESTHDQNEMRGRKNCRENIKQHQLFLFNLGADRSLCVYALDALVRAITEGQTTTTQDRITGSPLRKEENIILSKHESGYMY